MRSTRVFRANSLAVPSDRESTIDALSQVASEPSAGSEPESGDDADGAHTPEPRRVTEDGTEYLVTPTVAVKEGVYYYQTPMGISREYLSGEEIEQSVDDWEERPIVLDHPVTEDGDPTTFARGDATDKRNVGEVREPRTNTIEGDVSLVNESWFDLSNQGRFDGVFTEIVEELEAGEIVETSTGYDSLPVLNSGNHDGDVYDREQVGVEPDHLAILTDEEGNCSVAGGCGIGRLNHAMLNPNQNRSSPGVAGGGECHCGGDGEHSDPDEKTPTHNQIQIDDDQAEWFGRRFISTLFGLGNPDGVESETEPRANESGESNPSGSGESDDGEPDDEDGDEDDPDDDDDVEDGSDSDQDTMKNKELLKKLASDDSVPFGEETLKTMDEDALSTVENDYLSTDSDSDSDPDQDQDPADPADEDGDGDGSDGGDSDADGSDADDRIAQLESQIESLEETINEPKKQRRDEAAKVATANMQGVDPDDIELSDEAADKILAEANEGGQTGAGGYVDSLQEQGQGAEARTNMSGVPSSVTRANASLDEDDELDDVPTMNYADTLQEDD